MKKKVGLIITAGLLTSKVRAECVSGDSEALWELLPASLWWQPFRFTAHNFQPVCVCGRPISDLQVRAHFTNLPHDSLQRLTDVIATTAWQCHRGLVENWPCTCNGCNYVTVGAEKYCKLRVMDRLFPKIKKSWHPEGCRLLRQNHKSLHKHFGAVRLALALQLTVATIDCI